MNKKPKKRRPFEEVQNPHKLFRKMTQHHTDVLQNIEFALVSKYREHSVIDDRAVAQALEAAITDTEPTDAMSNVLFETLKETRLIRSDVSNDLWRAGLKVVLKSVHTHSDVRTGCRGYLNFVSGFIV